MVPRQPASVSDPVSDLLLRWHALREQGLNPSAEELCADRPELVGEVRDRVRALEAMEAALGVGPHTVGDPAAAEPGALARGSTFELPGYEILGVINQGGMGVVYKARQISLNRVVAVKTILGGPDAPPEGLARFRAEAEAVARLRHPNVVQIYEVGEHAGRAFFSMEYLEGGSLDRVLARSVVPARQAAGLLEPLARAVHHAHQQGIVHRDLKPANILLRRKSEIHNPKPEANPKEQNPKSETEGQRVSDLGRLGLGFVPDFGFRISDFEPKVSDFGLAKRLDRPGGQTAAGAVLGTPSYMAPEQTEGEPGKVGPAVDVYALGAILYETLTGRPPFRGETTLDTLEQVRRREPVPPARLQPGIPRDLETSCLKCLEKDPRRRYASAEALAEDLRRFLAGEPILARPTSVWGHGVKWARRKPALAGLLAVSAVAVAGLLGSWGWFTAELRDRVQFARDQEKLAWDNHRLAEQRRAEAEGNWTKAEEQRAEAVRGWQAAREQRERAQQQQERAEALLARCLAAIDEHAQATEVSKGEMRRTGEPGAILFGLARFFAQTSATYRRDEGLSAADRTRLADQYAARAVKLLDSAAQAKYFDSTRNYQQLTHDPGLEPLRARTDFRQLLARVESAPLRGSGSRRAP